MSTLRCFLKEGFGLGVEENGVWMGCGKYDIHDLLLGLLCSTSSVVYSNGIHPTVIHVSRLVLMI